MTRRRTLAWFLLLALFSTAVAFAQTRPASKTTNDPDKKEWIQLFNGKDLKDWSPKINGYDLNDNFGNTFRVENGVMTVGYEKYDKFDNRFGHIFYRDKFSNYIIAVEYRFVGEQAKEGPNWATRNSGIMVHCQSPQSMGKNQDFPISIEVQLLGGLGKGPRTTANLCTPGTNVEMNGKLFTQHCVNSSSKTYDGDQWVRVEVEVLGDKQIKHVIDGQTVLSYEKPQIGGGNVSNHDPAGEEGRGTAQRGLHLAAKREPPDRIPQEWSCSIWSAAWIRRRRITRRISSKPTTRNASTPSEGHLL